MPQDTQMLTNVIEPVFRESYGHCREIDVFRNGFIRRRDLNLSLRKYFPNF